MLTLAAFGPRAAGSPPLLSAFVMITTALELIIKDKAKFLASF